MTHVCTSLFWGAVKGGWGAAPNNNVQPRKTPNTQADTCFRHNPPNLGKPSRTVGDERSSPGSEMSVTRKNRCMCEGGVCASGLRRECIPGEGTTGSKERLHGIAGRQERRLCGMSGGPWICGIVMSMCLFTARGRIVHTEITTFSLVCTHTHTHTQNFF